MTYGRVAPARISGNRSSRRARGAGLFACSLAAYARGSIAAADSWDHLAAERVLHAGIIAKGASDGTSLRPWGQIHAAEPPNFVFILSDDLGYGELSIMPGRKDWSISTPNIDALFRTGMWFTSAYSNYVCSPSRASLMLGKHSGHSPIRGNNPVGGGRPELGPNDITFLQTLQASNYMTTCIGKWHMGGLKGDSTPWAKGCGRSYGGAGDRVSNNMYPTGLLVYDDSNGVVRYDRPENINASREVCQAIGNTCSWTGNLWTERALSELEHFAALQEQQRNSGASVTPFFMYLAITTPHAGYWGYTGRGAPVPSDGDFASEPWPDVEKDHASTIQNYHDVAVGQLTDRLDSLNLRANTVVFYLSDNGPHNEAGHDYSFFDSAGPLSGYKRWLAEGGIRVPFAVSWPGVIPAAAVSDTPVAVWDLAPTILSIAGVAQSSWPSDFDGISLFEGLLRPGGPLSTYSHPPLYWETCTVFRFERIDRIGTGWSRAVRSGDWKAIWHFDSGDWSGIQLFNITNDITESYDLSAAYPEVVAELEAFAEASHVEDPRYPRRDQCIPA